MKSTMNNTRVIAGQAMVFLLMMLAARTVFSCEGEELCSVTVVTIIASVMLGFTVIVAILKEAVDL